MPPYCLETSAVSMSEITEKPISYLLLSWVYDREAYYCTLFCEVKYETFGRTFQRIFPCPFSSLSSKDLKQTMVVRISNDSSTMPKT